MSIETFSPLPLTTFGTWITLLDPSDVPPGMSPDLRGRGIFPRRRAHAPGPRLAIRAARRRAATSTSLKTYITTNLVQRLLVLDSLGTILQGNFSRHARRR